MPRPEWMTGCTTSLSGLHIYEKVKAETKNDVDYVVCRSCKTSNAQHRVAILNFIEKAVEEERELKKEQEKAKAAYFRIGKRV